MPILSGSLRINSGRHGGNDVGIAANFDGGGGVEGWNDAGETFNVTFELVCRGYSEEQIAKFGA
jgi:membrane dipeptidase